MSLLAAAGALATAVVAASPSVIPVAVGAGAAFRPPARPAAVAAGQPVGELRCRADGSRFAVHVELFARGRAVVVPAGIGVADPSRSHLGTVVAGGCSYPLRTLTPTGIVGVRVGSMLRLADLFRIWGQPLTATRLGPFRSAAPVRAYVGGKRYPGDVARLPLTSGAEIVLELGAYVPPHPSFLFPKGSV
jgi:hypothetical protein